jgi:hypothetical protein
MAEVLDDGTIRIGVDDAGVAERLTKIEAEFKARLAAIGRQSATVSIKGNITDLRRNLAEAKAELASCKMQKTPSE